MNVMNRREFVRGVGAAAGAGLLGGCEWMRPSETSFYGPTIRDRLWMWGHHPLSLMPYKDKPIYNIPPRRHIDMAAACREMDIPGCFVVRWRNLPRKADIPEYMKQFKDTKRVGFSITDGAVETVEEKIRLGFEYADRMPNLTTLIMDDFFSAKANTRSADEIVRVREETAKRRMKLGMVLYSDANGLKPEFKPILDLFDEITFWFWNGKNVGTIEEQVGKLKDLIGSEKPILLGQYMYDFGAKRELPGRLMEDQLAATSRLLASRAIDGVIFHCTPLVDMDLDAVRLSREWIRAHARERWGAGTI